MLSFDLLVLYSNLTTLSQHFFPFCAAIITDAHYLGMTALNEMEKRADRNDIRENCSRAVCDFIIVLQKQASMKSRTLSLVCGHVTPFVCCVLKIIKATLFLLMCMK